MIKQEEANLSATVIGGAVGGGGSIVATLILSALATGLANRGMVGEASIDAVSVGILVLSSVVGSLLGCAVTGHRRVQVCLISGGVYYLALLACNVMLFDGIFRTVGVTGLVVLGGCGAVILLGLKEGKRGHRMGKTKNRNWKVVQK